MKLGYLVSSPEDYEYTYGLVVTIIEDNYRIFRYYNYSTENNNTLWDDHDTYFTVSHKDSTIYTDIFGELE